MTLMNMKKKINFLVVLIFATSCSLSPGMHIETKSSWADDSRYIYIDSLKNSFRLGAKADYVDYEMDDYVEDFDNYLFDRMDS